MQQEKDYIQREIQRLSLVLTKLIGMALGLKTQDVEQGVQNMESELKNEFDLTLREISEMTNIQLTHSIKGMHEQHLEKLLELMVALPNNPYSNVNHKIAGKGILILEYLDENSKNLLFKKNEIKKHLRTAAMIHLVLPA